MATGFATGTERDRDAGALGTARASGEDGTDNGCEDPRSEEETRAAAVLLSHKLLAVKFVQGLPVVGAVGGAVNFSAAGRVARWGALKYKKRFYEKKVRGL